MCNPLVLLENIPQKKKNKNKKKKKKENIPQWAHHVANELGR